MTDELERLRQRNLELERQLVKQSLSNALVLEFRNRGLDANQIEDALQILGASHDPASAENIRSDAVWFTANDPERLTLTELVDKFQESKGYFFTSEQRAEPAGPTDASEREVPVPEMTVEELAIAAGAAPEAQKPKERSYTDAEFENLSVMDRLAIQAGETPKVERNDSGIDELNAELEARAEHREETNKQRVESGGVRMFEAKKWGKA